MRKILGIDFGDVIVDSTSVDGKKFQQSEVYLSKTYIPGALDGIKSLLKLFDEIFIVSRVDSGNEQKVLSWLEKQDFFDQTGINPKAVHFVHNRQEKDAVCKNLGITHFIDDRLEVLGQMPTVQHKYLLSFNPKDDEEADFIHHKKDVAIARSWPELLKSIVG